MARLLPDEHISRDDMRGYRIFIWSEDHPYPPHVHVGRSRRVSDWRIDSLECIDGDGFTSSELRGQHTILRKYLPIICKFHEHWQ